MQQAEDRRVGEKLTRNIVVPQDRLGSLHGAKRVKVPSDLEIFILPSLAER